VSALPLRLDALAESLADEWPDDAELVRAAAAQLRVLEQEQAATRPMIERLQAEVARLTAELQAAASTPSRRKRTRWRVPQ
jgi:hypothetical protein